MSDYTAAREEILDVIQKISSDRSLLDKFLEDLLTPKEYEEIATRWQIIKELETGKSQRQITEQLGVGIATVTRGSRALQNAVGGFNQVLERIA